MIFVPNEEYDKLFLRAEMYYRVDEKHEAFAIFQGQYFTFKGTFISEKGGCNSCNDEGEKSYLVDGRADCDVPIEDQEKFEEAFEIPASYFSETDEIIDGYTIGESYDEEKRAINTPYLTPPWKRKGYRWDAQG